MCQRVSYSVYHWDGPSAIPHLDHLLSIPRLNCIQWTPGAGAEGVLDRKWWPLFHRIIEAGKRVFAYADNAGEGLPAVKKEFGPRMNSFLIHCWAKDPGDSARLIESVTF